MAPVDKKPPAKGAAKGQQTLTKSPAPTRRAQIDVGTPSQAQNTAQPDASGHLVAAESFPPRTHKLITVLLKGNVILAFVKHFAHTFLYPAFVQKAFNYIRDSPVARRASRVVHACYKADPVNPHRYEQTPKQTYQASPTNQNSRFSTIQLNVFVGVVLAQVKNPRPAATNQK